MLERSPLVLVLVLAAVFSVIYFPEMATFNLSIDEELAAFRTDPVVWISQGRWGTFLVEALLVQQPTIPYFPVAFFGLCLVTSFMLIRRSVPWREKPIGPSDVLTFAAFCGFPTWFFIVEFYSNIISVGLGALCCGAFVNLLTRSLCNEKWTEALAAAIAGAVAIGMYQSFAFAIAALAALALLQLLASEKLRWRQAIASSVVVSASGLGYYAANLVAFALAGAEPSKYVDSILDIDAAVNAPAAALLHVGQGFLSTFGFNADLYLYPAWGFAGVVVLAVPATLLATRPRHRATAAGLLLAALVAPFGLHLVSGGNLIPTRSIVAAPFVAWAVTHFALASSSQPLRLGGTVLAAVAVLQSMYLFSGYQAAIRVGLSYDRNLAVEVYSRVMDEASPARMPTYIDVFGGGWVFNPYPIPPSSTAGRSFFDWGNGTSDRIAYFITLSGFGNVQPLPKTRIGDYLDDFATMPTWPALGSIRVVDDVALIRLANVPDSHHQELLDARKSP
jgi:hypothetical protein